MGTQANGLNEAARRFARWRRSAGAPGRIPSALWELATEVALVYDVRETAQRLRVDEGRLKRADAGNRPVERADYGPICRAAAATTRFNSWLSGDSASRSLQAHQLQVLRKPTLAHRLGDRSKSPFKRYNRTNFRDLDKWHETCCTSTTRSIWLSILPVA